MSASDLLLARALREESGLLVARLARRFGDFDLAEEAVQQAVVEALTTWRRDGPPDNPAAWLQVAARRNALDAVRRAGRQRGLAARAEPPGAGEGPGTDDRLALLFACCHPSLAPEARLALTLRAVVGLTTPQIARAFLVNETTLAQRIVRAKRKIVTAGISLSGAGARRAVGAPRRRARRRLRDVQRGLRLLHRRHPGPRPRRRRRLAGGGRSRPACPTSRRPGGWPRCSPSSTPARPRASTPDGGLVLLRDQDRSRWDAAALATGEAYLERAAAHHRPGPYQLQAAIAACHASSPSWEETDWLQIVTLYDVLAHRDPSPVPRLNRAVALAQLGPEHADRALADVDALDRAARRLPPLPRDPGRAAHRPRAATTRRPTPTGGARADHQRRRAAAAHHPAAPAPAQRRVVTGSASRTRWSLIQATDSSVTT